MNILIINGHPGSQTLCSAIVESYTRGAAEGGATVRQLDLKSIDFNPILWEGYKKVQPLEPSLVQAQESIKWANHIVIIYPTWWFSVPALLKGFIDRVFLPGFAFNYQKGKLLPIQHLKGKTGRIITTMGAPSLIYRLIGEPSVKQIKLGTLGYCGVKPVKVTRFEKVFPQMDPNLSKKYVDKAFQIGKGDVK